MSGSWPTGSSATPRVGEDYRVHAAAAAGSGAAGDRFTWKLTAPGTGEYDIEVSCPAITGASTSARYAVATRDSSNGEVTYDAAFVDQDACASGDGETWQSLDTLGLSGGQPVNIRLRPSADGRVVADAVRLRERKRRGYSESRFGGPMQ